MTCFGLTPPPSLRVLRRNKAAATMGAQWWGLTHTSVSGPWLTEGPCDPSPDRASFPEPLYLPPPPPLADLSKSSPLPLVANENRWITRSSFSKSDPCELTSLVSPPPAKHTCMRERKRERKEACPPLCICFCVCPLSENTPCLCCWRRTDGRMED